MSDTTLIGVSPPDAVSTLGRLFEALAEAFPVRFVPANGDATFQARLALPGDGGEDARHEDTVPVYQVSASQSGTPAATEVVFQDADELDARLRRQRLSDGQAKGAPPLAPAPGETVMALSGGKPVWTRQEQESAFAYRVALGPAELAGEEVLRDQLKAGCFLRLLPLVHFLREVTVDAAWTPPPLRAAIIVDDPNLHAVSYGHIDYAALSAHAEQHGYHVAMATIPLDAWYANHKAAAFFQPGKCLSLLVHGNNHVRHELDRGGGTQACLGLLGQALRRTAALEHRAGVSVSRVMAAPHGRCSEAMMQAMRRLGFEAACISRPYPWRATPPPDALLAGWGPADLVAGGFPVIPRLHLNKDRNDLVLRAFLNQPLVLYGHQEDFAQGLDFLAEAAEFINRLGAVRWGSLGEIAAASYYRQRAAEVLHLRPLSRRLRVTVDPGLRTVHVARLPGAASSCHVETKGQRLRFGENEDVLALPVAPTSSGVMDLRFVDEDAVSHETTRRPGGGPWPLVRRALTELRDRGKPYASR